MGFQGDNKFQNKERVLATLKHFAAHGQPESGQNCAPVNVSMRVLRWMKSRAPEIVTKSGVMLGLGETEPEIFQTMDDLREHGVQVLTIGQYLQPSRDHLPIARYYHPDEYAQLRAAGLAMGFAHVESGPLVRSSYHARTQLDSAAPKP